MLSLRAIALATIFGVSIGAGGCDTKEEVVDIETPQGEVEVNEDTSSGAIEVDISEDP